MTKLIELAIWSAVIEGEDNPVSLLLVGRPESGKSQLILQFEGTPWTRNISDLTAWGFINEHVLPISQELSRSPDSVAQTVLMVPDLSLTLARTQTVVQTMCSNLAAYMEEGIGEIKTFNTKLTLKKRIRGSLITSCTKAHFTANKKIWLESGFASRFLVLSYKYDKETENAIAHAIWSDDKAGGVHRILPLPTVKIPVTYNLKDMEYCENLVPDYRQSLSLTEEGYGNRFRRHLKRLVKAHALHEHRTEVIPQDIMTVTELVDRYANLKFNPAR